jgi:hypothetical protein
MDDSFAIITNSSTCHSTSLPIRQLCTIGQGIGITCSHNASKEHLDFSNTDDDMQTEERRAAMIKQVCEIMNTMTNYLGPRGQFDEVL